MTISWPSTLASRTRSPARTLGTTSVGNSRDDTLTTLSARSRGSKRLVVIDLGQILNERGRQGRRARFADRGRRASLVGHHVPVGPGARAGRFAGC